MSDHYWFSQQHFDTKAANLSCSDVFFHTIEVNGRRVEYTNTSEIFPCPEYMWPDAVYLGQGVNPEHRRQP